MFYAHMRFVRSACFITASTLTLAAVSTGSAQVSQLSNAGAAVNLTAASAVGQPSPPPVLNPRHPETYVVQPTDTLWDIAAMFLRDPWYWPEIWQINPQVENPHLIYPGDILSLVYLNGRPAVQAERAASVVATGSGLVERLSPTVRSEPLEQPIPTIPFETLRAFLTRPVVLNRDQLNNLPYIFANPEGLMGSAGRDVYVRGTTEPVGTVFNIVQVGDALRDPEDNDVIGYEGLYVGQGRVTRTGDPSTLRLTDSAREALIGDYLVAEESLAPANFLPRAPENGVEGTIISVIDGVSLIGQYQVVVVNRGAQHGLESGHVLQIYQTGRVVEDKVKRGLFDQNVRLPDEPAGTMMVFRVFDRISYALVMEATRAIAELDTVRRP